LDNAAKHLQALAPFVDLHLPTLTLGAALTAGVSAAAVSLTARSHLALRGLRWWLGALWAIALGLLLHVFGHVLAPVDLLSHLMLACWPLGMLQGVREFDSRVRLACGPRTDAWLAGGAGLAIVLPHAAGATPALGFAVFTGCAALLCGYTCALLVTARAGGAPRLMQHFGALLGLTCAALLLRGLAVLDGADVPAQDAALAHALTLGLAAAAFAHVSVHAMFDRTSRELRQSRRRLRTLANTDMLTRVPNRRHFMELARRAVGRTEPGSAAVVMFDIDHFKRINDQLGHAAGDRALRRVSRCMQESLREHDVAGRHGGDEFALLLPRTRAEDAMHVAARIAHRVQVRGASNEANPQRLPRLSLSFGVVQMLPDETIDDALRRADQALYEAKRQGRGRAVVAEGDEERPVFTESQRLGLTPR
jgi:diguanylate cyclase (GGDEF)-like protein